jgi:hypothetical protein
MDDFELQADQVYDGPVDDYGEPKISNEDLDIEVRFQKTGPTLYRFTFEGTRTRQAICGPWREKRSDAYGQGQQYVKTGRL